MNKQETFDKVAKHLLTQNAKSVNGGRCSYRGAEGRMCAVGCLIDDEHYSPALEGCHVWFPDVRTALSKSGVPNEVVGTLLDALKTIHDCYPLEDWRAELYILAEHHGLNVAGLYVS